MIPPSRLSLAVWLLVATAAKAADKPPTEGVVLGAMQAELDRSFSKLKNAGEAPLYFLAYRVYDTESIDLAAEYGALEATSTGGRSRRLDIDLRVGGPDLDNTHKVRGEGFEFGDLDFFGATGLALMPIEDDEAAIRTALWARTDSEFKSAQKQLTKVKANKDVKVEEEDTSADFSVETPQVYSGPAVDLPVDRPAWEARLRRASAIYRDHPAIKDSSIRFTATRTRRFLVTSEGTRIQDERSQYRLFTTAAALADDGMRLWLYDGVEATSPSDLPDDAKLDEMVRKLAQSLVTLKAAAPAEPYAGPAILRSRAAGVFFHEIFGHRIEGHRQKDEDEGRTFAKKIGQPIMPEFISVVDDPTRERLGSRPLNGFYRFDDEGVPAQRVVLVESGVLKSFLMGRSPVRGFPTSNGHGRCSAGSAPVARQGNLAVEPSKRVPYAKLREMLIEEVKRQGKPYGLVFDEIAGGFTMTQTFVPQSFKLLPLRVTRVFPDGRPDELLRGVDLVGTPLASLERILGAGDDDDTFNGTCGAESGWVPVSASSPSLLVQTIEVERQSKAQDKPPLLPAPRHDPDESPNKPAKPAEKVSRP